MSNSNTIMGGCNNIVTSTCSSIIGGQNSISTCGSIGINGGTNPRGYQITDWKEDLQKKYPRFTITTEYDDMTFTPTNIIIDNNTQKEYKFKPQSGTTPTITAGGVTTIMNETDLFIQRLIVTIREDKINTIINDSES
jgi:hypothetical protein